MAQFRHHDGMDIRVRRLFYWYPLPDIYGHSEITIYYSKGHSRLEVVVGPTFNNNSGGGQFHAGLLKLPTGPLGIDVLHEGFQETHLNEGLIYSGVFIESSLDSCVTTVPPLI